MNYPYLLIGLCAATGILVYGLPGGIVGCALGLLLCHFIGSMIRATTGAMDERVRSALLSSFWALRRFELAERFPQLSEVQQSGRLSATLNAIVVETEWGIAGAPTPSGFTRPAFWDACQRLADRTKDPSEKWLVETLARHVSIAIEMEAFIATDYKFGRIARRAGQY